ncbi:MAG: cupin domain-containing protein [Sphingopyxis macrogoltabida]|uniref:Cupin domain-containing protein n=1 Tax=Sphingopyxis macrogoltabida TaxID=33050 RepID=A0A2W5LAL5_SPHMC|nr:MAG: cupin domain-containing protein [Sphingopyxis macrogoltabida]
MEGPPLTRRIVTAVDEAGLSYIAEDGSSPSLVTIEARPGFRNNNIWRTLGADARVDAPDTILDQQGACPPAGGTVIRVVDVPPESSDMAEVTKVYDSLIKSVYPDIDHRPDNRHPGMHVTNTIDYAIVLSGELVAILDKEETVMKAGDILIQRGTNHAWANRSGKMVRIAFILTDSSPA